MSGNLLVTGGGRGIGAATVRLAAREGYAVCVNYRDRAAPAEALVAAIREAGGSALALQADIAREDEVQRLFAAMDRELGPATALVNNAGLAGPASRLDEADGADLRRVVEVNLLGALYCARAAVRRMAPRHGGRGGAIVNISSVAATLGSPGEYVWYAAAKAGVDALTVGLARELAGEGIRVNAVAPGLVKTTIHADSGMPDRLERIASTVPIGRAGEPEEIAQAVVWLLSEHASYTTGAVLRVGGGR